MRPPPENQEAALGAEPGAALENLSQDQHRPSQGGPDASEHNDSRKKLKPVAASPWPQSDCGMASAMRLGSPIRLSIVSRGIVTNIRFRRQRLEGGAT